MTACDAPIANLVAGGAGRYLILHLKSQRKLVVHDLQRDAAAFTVPLAEDEVFFAAGREWLWVFLLKAHVVQRWNLPTGERITEAGIPVPGPLKAVVAGVDSDGPLLWLHPENANQPDSLIWSFADAEMLKLRSLQPRASESRPVTSELESQRAEARQLGLRSRGVVHARASANGRAFALWSTSYTPQGIALLTVSLDGDEVHPVRVSAGYLAPSFGGQWLLTDRGLAELETAAAAAPKPVSIGGFPAIDDSLYLARRPDGSLELRLLDGDKLLARLPKFELPRPNSEDFLLHDFTQEKRLTLVARLGCLAYVPPSNDQIVTYRLDIPKLLRDAGVASLTIVSRPPVAISRGQKLEYEIQVRSDSGSVSYRLDFAPPNMSLSTTGKLNWEVPADFSESEATVIINVSDRSGEQFQAFVVRVDRS